MQAEHGIKQKNKYSKAVSIFIIEETIRWAFFMKDGHGE
jgi:hypothetical protein